MRASEKTNAINAYVTGIGASKRVVIWDTTIKKTTSDEALFIVGHELGHYVLGHVVTGFLYFAIALLAGFVHHVSRAALDAAIVGAWSGKFTGRKTGRRWRCWHSSYKF